MITLQFRLLGVDVMYIDGAVTCSVGGEPAGVYTMGATMIVGSTLLPTDTRRAIHAEIERVIESVPV